MCWKRGRHHRRKKASSIYTPFDKTVTTSKLVEEKKQRSLLRARLQMVCNQRKCHHMLEKRTSSTTGTKDTILESTKATTEDFQSSGNSMTSGQEQLEQSTASPVWKPKSGLYSGEIRSSSISKHKENAAAVTEKKPIYGTGKKTGAIPPKKRERNTAVPIDKEKKTGATLKNEPATLVSSVISIKENNEARIVSKKGKHSHTVDDVNTIMAHPQNISIENPSAITQGIKESVITETRQRVLLETRLESKRHKMNNKHDSDSIKSSSSSTIFEEIKRSVIKETRQRALLESRLKMERENCLRLQESVTITRKEENSDNISNVYSMMEIMTSLDALLQMEKILRRSLRLWGQKEEESKHTNKRKDVTNIYERVPEDNNTVMTKKNDVTHVYEILPKYRNVMKKKEVTNIYKHSSQYNTEMKKEVVTNAYEPFTANDYSNTCFSTSITSAQKKKKKKKLKIYKIK